MCRLSRLVALEAWKNDLGGMVVGLGKKDYIDRYMGKSRMEMRETLLGEVEVLIRMIRGDDQGGPVGSKMHGTRLKASKS